KGASRHAVLLSGGLSRISGRARAAMVNAFCFFAISRQLRRRNKSRGRTLGRRTATTDGWRVVSTWFGPRSAADRDQPVALGPDALDDPGEGRQRLATVSPAVVQEDDRPGGEVGQGPPHDRVGTG